jgi:hypothetical protein
MSERWLKEVCPRDFSSDNMIVRNHSVVGHGNILINGWWQPGIVSAFVLREIHSLVWAEMRFISAHMLWCFDPECHPESRTYIDNCKTSFLWEILALDMKLDMSRLRKAQIHQGCRGRVAPMD